MRLHAKPNSGTAVSGWTFQQPLCWKVSGEQACQQLVLDSAFYLGLEDFLSVDVWTSEVKLQQLDGV